MMVMKKINLEKKKINNDLLIKYGFIKRNNSYCYEKNIMNNDFKVMIEIINNSMFVKIIDNAFNEEYLMSNIEDISGNFIGKLKDEYEGIIEDIIDKCCEYDVFECNESKMIINYLKEKYDGELEYLWDKYPEFGVCRNGKTRKWFIMIGKIEKDKIIGDSKEMVEIIDLHYDKDKILDIIDNKKIYPGYHMNKKSWITIILDGNNDFERIKELIDNSYLLSERR